MKTFQVTIFDAGVSVTTTINAAGIESACEAIQAMVREEEEVTAGNPDCEPRTEWSCIIVGDRASCSLRAKGEQDAAAWLSVTVAEEEGPEETMTLREKARQSVIDSVTEALDKSHRRNYHRLHVRRDGTVNWSEEANRSSDIIDGQAEGFQPVPGVALEGTGSYACNCGHCNEIYSPEDEQRALETGREYDRAKKYQTHEEAIADAIGDSDTADKEIEMLAKFDAIAVGYFDDEHVRRDGTVN